MKERNILVTAIGSFSADIVISTLQNNGYRVIGTNIYPMEWIANAIIVDSFYQVPLASDERNYINAMLDLCKKENVGYIFPLTDAEIDVFNRHRKVFYEIGVVLCMSSYETILICRDKRKTSKVLQNISGLQIIPEYQEEAIKHEMVQFPILCKKINGRSSQGQKKINNMNELFSFLENHDVTSYIIQPYIKGDIITVDVVRDSKNGKSVATPRRELLRTLNGAGTSVYVFKDSKLENLCKKIAERLNVCGCVNFEFIEVNGRYYFLECNPRFSGGVKFTCMSGYNCILNHLRCFQEEKIEEEGEIISQYIARKYNEYITSVK